MKQNDKLALCKSTVEVTEDHFTSRAFFAMGAFIYGRVPG
jgi:hypothetical protein